MQIRKLRNKLAGVDVRREGGVMDRLRGKGKVTFEGAGLKYSVDANDKRSEEEIAAAIASRIPTAVIMPPR